MNRALIGTLAAMLACIAGCSSGVIGSCSFASGAVCAEYVTYVMGTPPAISCTDTLAGTWAEAAACPSGGRVGRCHVETDRGVARVIYYAPLTPADAETNCSGIEGGTFQPE